MSSLSIAIAAAAVQATQVAAPVTDQPYGIKPPVPDSHPASMEVGDAPIPIGRRRDLFIAPVPFLSPAIGSGLAVVVGNVFRLNRKDMVSPPSTAMIGGLRSSNGTQGAFAGGRFFLQEDHLRFTLGVGTMDANYSYYGVGNEGSNAALPINQEIDGFLVMGLSKVAPSIYAGLRYVGGKSTIRLRDVPGVLPPGELDTTIGGLGVVADYDTIGDRFWPTGGEAASVRGMFFSEALGDSFDYQVYEGRYRRFYGLDTSESGPNSVLGLQAFAASAQGHVPFYNLPSVGGSDNLRGYLRGRYRDRTLLSFQAEYRRYLGRRFGVVAFAGTSVVADTLGKVSAANLLPAAGVGVRFQLTRESRMNYRADFAAGRDGGYFYFGVGEAF